MNRGEIIEALRDARWVVEDDADAEYVDLPKMASALLSLAEQLKEAMTALEQIAKAKERWDAAMEHVLQHIEHDDGAEWRSASHHEGVMAEAYHKASDGARRILSRWEAP